MYNISNKQYNEIVEYLKDYTENRDTPDLRTFNKVRKAKMLVRSLKKKQPI